MSFEHLKSYLPENSLSIIEKWIRNYPLRLKITKNRQTKLGDYRQILTNKSNQITINGDLNAFAFLFVLTHEIAHMHVYNIYHYNSVLPHGKEWKDIFRNLLLESVNLYPPELQLYILNHAKSPKASVGADPNIAKYILKELNQFQNFLEDLESGSFFLLGKKIFIKGEKRKLRYVCCDIKTKRNYLINSTAIVEKLNYDESI